MFYERKGGQERKNENLKDGNWKQGNEWEEGWIIEREKFASTRLRKSGKWQNKRWWFKRGRKGQVRKDMNQEGR